MKTIITVIISIALATFAQAQQKVSISDFESLDNTNWTGELMYVNYSDSKEVILPTTLRIEVEKNKIIFYKKYTTEESANDKSTIKIKKDGTYLGNEKIIRVQRSTDGSIEVETRYEGKDANRDATIYITYSFNEHQLSMKKEVEFKDAPGKFVRNQYSYTES
ncbi:hypothetical protein H2O64_16745 [Kordia sp. YSTF-M3]|uniref:Uncharacterized protein n=1 Tax=Kordia aestuariivivens TaxID=2759037 RepID=A0ABR7QCM7_9FLAO|nr:hypothetical protein [Kordia aestuariivivens]MBC8756325.1 hypothetical protein [Kordia aestuariivivens]